MDTLRTIIAKTHRMLFFCSFYIALTGVEYSSVNGRPRYLVKEDSLNIHHLGLGEGFIHMGVCGIQISHVLLVGLFCIMGFGFWAWRFSVDLAIWKSIKERMGSERCILEWTTIRWIITEAESIIN